MYRFVLGFSRENRTNGIYVDVYIAVLLQELAHVVMEAQKSHDLPPASWRTWKASGVIQFKSKGLRIGVGGEGWW